MPAHLNCFSEVRPHTFLIFLPHSSLEKIQKEKRLSMDITQSPSQKSNRQLSIRDFEILKPISKGAFG